MVTRKKSVRNHLKLHFEPEDDGNGGNAEESPPPEYLEIFVEASDTEKIVAQLEARVRSFRDPAEPPPSTTTTTIPTTDISGTTMTSNNNPATPTTSKLIPPNDES